ncbi:OmpA family protein [Hymenobacter terricola]|uniref:OmpA family protein n=1 Tax=Hymenobacter terricola TaxID=2819236 RepID=UPI001B30A5C2|nr:OmpA family protein [Hymenobacter terricola]
MRHVFLSFCLLLSQGWGDQGLHGQPSCPQALPPVAAVPSFAPAVLVRGGVYSRQDSTTGVPGAEVVFRSGTDSAAAPYRAQTGADGSYRLAVPGGRTYQVDVYQLGQRAVRRAVPVPSAGTFWVGFYVDYHPDPARSGAIVEPAPATFFAVRQRALRPEGRKLLTYLGRVLREQPDLRVQVEGHADAREAPAHHPDPAGYLQRLGAQRARAVADCLRELGIPAARLMVLSYGARRPAAPNDGPENRQLNRRVDLKALRSQSPRKKPPPNPAK